MGDHTRTEERDEDGVVKGEYAFVAPEGNEYEFKYEADKEGYRVESEHLPEHPGDTDEVKLAREEFLKEYERIVERAKEAGEYEEYEYRGEDYEDDDDDDDDGDDDDDDSDEDESSEESSEEDSDENYALFAYGFGNSLTESSEESSEEDSDEDEEEEEEELVRVAPRRRFGFGSFRQSRTRKVEEEKEEPIVRAAPVRRRFGSSRQPTPKKREEELPSPNSALFAHFGLRTSPYKSKRL